MNAKGDTLNCVKSLQNTAWAHVFLMLALATSIKIRAKIDEKLHVFGDVDFKRIWGGFWEGFGRPKSSIFALFSMFFRCYFSSALRKGKKLRKNAKKPNFSAFWRRVCGGPQAPGERKG